MMPLRHFACLTHLKNITSRRIANTKTFSCQFRSTSRKWIEEKTLEIPLVSTLPLTIKEILQASQVGETITVRGWVRTARKQKKWVFVDISDGSCTTPLQVIISNLEQYEEDELKSLSTGSSIELIGTLHNNPKNKDVFEVQAQSYNILGKSDAQSYPLQKKAHGSEFLRTNGHLRPRTSRMQALFRLRSETEFAIQQVFKDQKFTQVHTPIITSHDCEGGGEVFQVLSKGKDFFETPAYLTVSGQLHLEMAANAMTRVYTLGPTFRAEGSITGRHLSEFWMLEAEVAFVSSLGPLLDLAETIIRRSTQQVLDKSHEDIVYFDKNSTNPGKLIRVLEKLVSKPFQRMTYTEAIEILQDAVQNKGVSFDHAPVWGSSLQSEHENYLAQTVCEGAVFVTNYPQKVKPFYMKIDRGSSPPTVSCFDLLLPEVGELMGGSLREDDIDVLKNSISQLGDTNMASQYDWYLDLRRYGSTPHGGFGLGVERLIQLLSDTPHIRDLSPYPRYIGNCRF